jgi:hypothetical protein
VLHGQESHYSLDAQDGQRGNDALDGGRASDACEADPDDMRRDC